MPVGFKHSWLSTSHYLLEKHKLCDGDSLRVRGARAPARRRDALPRGTAFEKVKGARDRLRGELSSVQRTDEDELVKSATACAHRLNQRLSRMRKLGREATTADAPEPAPEAPIKPEPAAPEPAPEASMKPEPAAPEPAPEAPMKPEPAAPEPAPEAPMKPEPAAPKPAPRRPLLP